MSSVQKYVQIIEKTFPLFTIYSATLNQAGQYNNVVIVNDELVFRFAKFASAAATLQREVAILSHLQNHISLSIPNPLYLHLTAEDVEEVFVGYRLIPGVPLWHERFQTITDEHVLNQIARQLATFLRELHSIPVEQVIPIALPVEDKLEDWRTLYEGIREKLFVYMRAEAPAQVIHNFETYLNDPQAHHFKPVLRHGDFGTGNILVDSQTNLITGIIDFGMTTLGDPATDFAALSTYGESFRARFYPVYPEIYATLPRLQFYRSTFALQEALFGIEHGDRAAFDAGIFEYR